ncbi:MAG: ATP cone domain-containing protein [Candidatus Paceibacterota bacterium]
MAKTAENVSKTAAKSRKTPKKVYLREVQKRNGTLVQYDRGRIEMAVRKAMIAAEEGSEKDAVQVSRAVERELIKILKTHKTFVPTVEGIQDSVEQELVEANFPKTAKAYILYREERSKLRAAGVPVPEHVRKLTEESKKYFRNPLAEFIYYRTYSKWIESEGRRETWIETVDRYMGFMRENIGDALSKKEYSEVRSAILAHEAMPSMRLMWSAGDAARKTNVTGYNCSYIAPSKIEDFAEIMYLSMCGTGVGFSVEEANVQSLPQIKRQTGEKSPTHTVADSKEGWADAFTAGLRHWFDGKDIDFNYSELRPAGARLRTMGGKSSGPQPLIDLMRYARTKIFSKQDKRLSTLDVHDIVCYIGQIVVSGGVRRSALISLSDLDDEEMRHAKDGQFWNTEPQRSMANNSAVYNEKPSNAEFLDEWLSLVRSGSGERGIFNRGALPKQLPERRVENWTQSGYIVNGQVVGSAGTNPCGEIVLKSKQFCNLSEVVARDDDDEASLLRKVRIAAILGTYQSTLTHFPYLSKEWTENCESERLLGVSITGQWDSEVARDPKVLRKLKAAAIKWNKKYAEKMGVNPSTAVTTVKPSGTVSQLVDAASGMHARHSKYYIRRVRIASTDSLFRMLKDQGVPFNPEVGHTEETATTFVIDFPVAAPGSIFKDDLSARDQLKHWKTVKENYTEHNPSITVSVGESEWIETGNWVYQNWDIVGGLSFLPRSNHVYQLAPYEECDKKTFEALSKRFEGVDFSKIVTYEQTDETKGAKELACSSGVCETDDVLAK